MGKPKKRLARGYDDLAPEAKTASRVSAGHPEGDLLAFANLYREFSQGLMARALGRPSNLSRFVHIRPFESTAPKLFANETLYQLSYTHNLIDFNELDANPGARNILVYTVQTDEGKRYLERHKLSTSQLPRSVPNVPSLERHESTGLTLL